MHRTLPHTATLPYALYTAAQVRSLDRVIIEQFEVPGAELMERAGVAAFALSQERWPEAMDITVLVGAGNNGGDGFVFARHAHDSGLSVRVLQVGDRGLLKGDALAMAELWAEAGGTWEDFDGLPRDTDLLVDGLLGTGLDRDPVGQYRAAVEAMNQHRAAVLALDVPSGLHADTGRALGIAVHAEATITFVGLKIGLFTGYGPGYAGEVSFDALQAPARAYASELLAARRLDWDKQSGLLAPRSAVAHKGDCGHVLVIGGVPGYVGAAVLAGEAALRSGAGLVSLAVAPGQAVGLVAARPELMCHEVSDRAELAPLLRRASVVVVGPGLGQDARAGDLLRGAINSGLPMVVDADALNLLARHPLASDRWVLTPHPGEAGRLLGVSASEVQADRLAAAERLQQRYGGVVLLKGPGTVVTGAGRRPPAVCTEGNPGMASGGMGDVLSGVIGALLAQGIEPRDAAEAGACLHGAAADRAAAQGERGMIASDLFSHLRRLVNG